MEATTANEAQLSFAFVESLAAELSKGRIQLPSFPEVALRVQRVLSSEDVNATVVERAIGAEPALALRIMRMANSVALNPDGYAVSNLHAAVSRIGYNMVRTASVSFALDQLRHAAKLKPYKAALDALWERGIEVAALASVLARRHTDINSDVAMLSGLLHGIGKLYILTRLSDHPGLQQYPEACERISRDWHSAIARALLDNWEIAEEVGLAVQEYEDLERDARGHVTLSDVLALANLLAGSDPANLDALLVQGRRLCLRLKVDKTASEALLQQSSEGVLALRAMLGN